MADTTVPTLAAGAFKHEVTLSLSAILREIISTLTQDIRKVLRSESEAKSSVPVSDTQMEKFMRGMWQDVATWNDMHQRDFAKRMAGRWLRLAKLCEDAYLCFGRACFEYLPNAADYTLVTDIPPTQTILYELLRMASHEPVVNTGRFDTVSMLDQTIIVQSIMRLTFNQLVSLGSTQVVPNNLVRQPAAPVAPVAVTAPPAAIADTPAAIADTALPATDMPATVPITAPITAPITVDTLAVETSKPAETAPVEAKAAEVTPPAAPTTEAKAGEAASTEAKAAEVKAADAALTTEAKATAESKAAVPEVAADLKAADALTAAASAVAAVTEAKSDITEVPHAHGLPPPSPAALSDKTHRMDGSSKDEDPGYHLPNAKTADYTAEVNKALESVIKVITPETHVPALTPGDSITDKIAPMQVSHTPVVPTAEPLSQQQQSQAATNTGISGLTGLNLSQLATPTSTPTVTRL